jgi:hypothetical protein
MGHSSLLGTDPAQLQADGHDVSTLGPGDSSDSGSDMVGLDAWADGADPTEPVDVALRGNRQRSALPQESLIGSTGDASGTGERRSAGADAGTREAADISVDRVFDLNDPLSSQDANEIDEAQPWTQASAAQDADEDEEEDGPSQKENESADPVGDGHSDADLARRLSPI